MYVPINQLQLDSHYELPTLAIYVPSVYREQIQNQFVTETTLENGVILRDTTPIFYWENKEEI